MSAPDCDESHVRSSLKSASAVLWKKRRDPNIPQHQTASKAPYTARQAETGATQNNFHMPPDKAVANNRKNTNDIFFQRTALFTSIRRPFHGKTDLPPQRNVC